MRGGSYGGGLLPPNSGKGGRHRLFDIKEISAFFFIAGGDAGIPSVAAVSAARFPQRLLSPTPPKGRKSDASQQTNVFPKNQSWKALQNTLQINSRDVLDQPRMHWRVSGPPEQGGRRSAESSSLQLNPSLNVCRMQRMGVSNAAARAGGNAASGIQLKASGCSSWRRPFAPPCADAVGRTAPLCVCLFLLHY